MALDRFSLEVPGGSVFALLGENGAGKTTAIRILLGLAEPDSGQSEVLGLASAAKGLEIRRRVGYVPERLTLYEWITVEEIGWFTAGFYGERFLPEYRRLVTQFGLPAQGKIKSLSKGMRAKVGLSLAMAHDPEVLVLDEPTSGLDALVRREFLESMVDRAATGKTVFLSSHQIVEVERVADIVAILHQGRLMLVERLDDLKAQVRELTFTMSNGAAPAGPAGRGALPPSAGPAVAGLAAYGGRMCWPRSARTPAWKTSRPGSRAWKRSSSPTCSRAARPALGILPGRMPCHERHNLLADCLERVPRSGPSGFPWPC